MITYTKGDTKMSLLGMLGRKNSHRPKALLTTKTASNTVFRGVETTDIFERKRIFKEDNKLVYLELKDIIFVTRENRQTAIYHTGGKVIIKSSLSDVEQQLGGYPFYRSHVGFIVNLNMVKEIIPTGRNSYEVVFADTDKKALMTREKVRELEKLINSRR